MPRVTLVLASGPTFPEGSPDYRYELDLRFDQEGRADAAAWETDAAPWPVRRFRPGEPEQDGDIQYDPDEGWSMRFFGNDEANPDDAPVAAIIMHEGRWRPGETATLRGRGGRESVWRIVAVT